MGGTKSDHSHFVDDGGSNEYNTGDQILNCVYVQYFEAFIVMMFKCDDCDQLQFQTGFLFDRDRANPE